ncbi:hypothetical protein [Gilvibacter sediminis]|uniref:hypothetical protein n=1 Tax=Gilvibacter sediminis TaxID=379071 RepID=UPI00235076ED|nr:hypothetical protein [Gilvibacter sediminis]MDC7997698.1 hypothetical protein [Gilvibacter sediminis]
MNRELIVLENRYRANHRVVLISFAVISFLFVINSINEAGDLTGPLVTVFFLILSAYLACLAFAKKGLLRKGDKLYRTLSLGRVLLFKTFVPFQNRKVISALNLSKRYRFSFVPSGGESSGESENVKELFLLSDDHMQRDSIIYLDKETNCDLAVRFLTENFDLHYEDFRPRSK